MAWSSARSVVDETEGGEWHPASEMALFRHQVGHFDRPVGELDDIWLDHCPHPSSLLDEDLRNANVARQFHFGRPSDAEFDRVIHGATFKRPLLLPSLFGKAGSVPKGQRGAVRAPQDPSAERLAMQEMLDEPRRTRKVPKEKVPIVRHVPRLRHLDWPGGEMPSIFVFEKRSTRVACRGHRYQRRDRPACGSIPNCLLIVCSPEECQPRGF